MNTLAYFIMVPIRNLLKHGRKDMFTSVAIETSSWCNRKCVYCPNSTNERPREFLDEGIIHDVLDQLGEIGFDGKVYFHLFNEPLLDKRLAGIIRYARTKCSRAALMLSTNGDVLSLQKMREFITAGIDGILVTQYDGSISENIAALTDSLTAEERKCISVRVRNVFDNNRGGAVGAAGTSGTLNKRCFRPFRMLVINYKGEAVVCCNDYFGREVVGDAKTDRLADIWFGEKMNSFRQALSMGDRHISPLCMHCNEALPREDGLKDLSNTSLYKFLKELYFIR